MAPRRVREILTRWSRDGAPDEYAGHVPEGAMASQKIPGHVAVAANANRNPSREAPAESSVDPGQSVRGDGSGTEPFVAPVFTMDACGMSNRQIWSAVLSDLQCSGAVTQAEVSTWLRDSAVIGISEEGALVIGVAHELARRRASGRYLALIRQAVRQVTGLSLAIEVVLFRDWPAA